MDADQIDSYTKLIGQIGSLRDTVVVAAICISIIGMIAFIVYMYLNYRQRILVETGKQARARATTQAMQAQAMAISRLSEMMEKTNTTNTIMVKKVDSTIAEMKAAMREMTSATTHVESLVQLVLERQDGVANWPTTMMILQTYFYKVLFSDATLIVHKSLHENDYKNRSEFIADKVRTDIGHVMASMRSELMELDLAFNPEPFFKMSNDTTDRYLLVDEVWTAVQPLYLSTLDLYGKWEEATYKINNTIKDHFAVIRNDVIEHGSGAHKIKKSKSTDR